MDSIIRKTRRGIGKKRLRNRRVFSVAYHIYQLGQPKKPTDVPLQATRSVAHRTKRPTSTPYSAPTPHTSTTAPHTLASKTPIGNPTYTQKPYAPTDREPQDNDTATPIKKDYHLLFYRRDIFRFSMAVSTVVMIVVLLGTVGDAFAIKKDVMTKVDRLRALSTQVATHSHQKDISALHGDIQTTHFILKDIQDTLGDMNEIIIWMSQFVPGAAQLSSGNAIVHAGISLTHASDTLLSFTETLQQTIDRKKQAPFNVLPLLQKTFAILSSIAQDLENAQSNLDNVNIATLPKDYRAKVSALRRVLPALTNQLHQTIALQKVLEDVVGKNGPRTYLFLFQNNQEMRPTGGFIGSYGLLDMDHGQVKNFYIDGIYNPDGQLKDHIVPPRPLQKISAAWSLHDSNWWPDFPKSAETAIDFFERTGGKTPDGVIMITPTMLEKLLEITGPIAMPQYNVTLTSDNVIEQTQQKVEIDYDKTKNQPKKILHDMMPLLIEKLRDDLSAQNILRIMDVVMQGLRQKHITLYMRNTQLQRYISDHGWAGEIATTDGDYLNVINTNINGFKTDGVITQRVHHAVNIRDDGHVIDTVTITRTHNGGHTGRMWWDAVNADYMRVYVPEGSQLLSARGYTRETHSERLSYDQLGFERNSDVVAEEQRITIDEKTGTRIYTENGKTVFANWVYVSPQETVEVEYTYELPEALHFTQDHDGLSVGTYSLLRQKQAGSTKESFTAEISYPKDYNLAWSNYKEHKEQTLSTEIPLTTDQYFAAVFTRMP